MICALEGIQCDANAQDNMHNRQRTADKKDCNAFFNTVKRPGWCYLDWVHKPLTAASSSTISVSQQATTWAVNNADRLTSFCAKRRARGCEMNQPTLPNCTRRQLMRSPRGSGGLSRRWRAPAPSVRRQGGVWGKAGGPDFSPKIHPARGMCILRRAWHTVVHDQLC